MLAYLLRRILSTIPVMGMVALFVFSLLYIAPGDPASIIAGDQATPEQIDRIRQSLGLDRPFLVRFGEWLWQIIHGDLGTSIFTNLPVSHMIAQRIEPTVSLMVLTIVFSIALIFGNRAFASDTHPPLRNLTHDYLRHRDISNRRVMGLVSGHRSGGYDSDSNGRK